MQTLDISQSKASRILNTLYDVGFLKLHKDGLWSLYSVDLDEMDGHLKEIMEATRRTFSGNKQMEMDRERLKTTERIGPGCGNESCQTNLSPETFQP
jgi:hypothetical protein